MFCLPRQTLVSRCRNDPHSIEWLVNQTKGWLAGDVLEGVLALIHRRRARLPISMENSGLLVLHIGDPQVDDPVCEIEAHETDWKHDARVLINVRRIYPEKLVRVFAGKCGLDLSRTTAAARRWSRLRRLRRRLLARALRVRFLQLQGTTDHSHV